MAMKTAGIKSWFRDVLAMSTLLAILIMQTIEAALLHVLSHIKIETFVAVMDNPCPWRPRAATLDRETAKPVEGIDLAAIFIDELEARDNDVVAAARRLLERTYYGEYVAEVWPDRHDYIVAVPTKQEDLRRIANVFVVIPKSARADVIGFLRRSCRRYGDSGLDNLRH